MPDSYEYNRECVYLFKPRNHPRSGNGLSHFQRVGIETMFARLVHEFGSIFNRNNLKISGFLDEMYKENPSTSWTIRMINEFKKDKGYSVNSVNAKIFFLRKYFPESLKEDLNQ